ncbi:hypothetical protein PG913_05865 [Tenacibaculum pacificus]|uniref:hypothetical protein n=1 Tax=Tenacibaculum pacificus TaxID=3018314 RepID=UPI0022F4037B|nr:hypothetical protein [Tenacibaculum pacificus]WBX74695.1 hypothetical protein PG913_05865 [Tenacibaculum pacificus]
MTKYITPFILISLFIGCNIPKKPEITYFGGKIINPKCGYITLSDNYKFNDTIYLKKDNSFLGSYKDFKKGLYVFGHGPEHQYVYLEPKDSLLFRLNTWDFDESLVFSGKDAERNNMLIEAFLEKEKDEKNFYRLYNLSQDKFLKKIDSIKKIKQEKLVFFKENAKNKVSKEFIEILNIALLYPVYTYLEQYAIHNFTKKVPEKLVPSYFDYRSNINSKKDSLIFYSPYYALMIDKLYNDVYLKEGNSENFTLNLLNNINSNISSEEIKNKLLYNTVISHFFKEPNSQDKNKTFFTFFKLNTDIDQKKNIQRLVNDLKLLNKGDKLPPFKLINAKGELKSISKIIKGKNAVILLKDNKYASDDWIASRTNYLIKNNPNITFIVINLCDTSNKYTKEIPIKHQYTLPKNSKVCDFSTSKFPRMVLIDKQGIIKNGYTSLSAKNINTEVSNLLKNK